MLNISTDVELSKLLGIRNSTISTWKSRNTLDYDLIFEKCKNIDYQFLITGIPVNSQYANNIVNEEGVMYKTLPPGPCQQCNLRERLLEAKDITIKALQDQIAEIKSGA